jgi:hypothetical protein
MNKTQPPKKEEKTPVDSTGKSIEILKTPVDSTGKLIEMLKLNMIPVAAAIVILIFISW